MSAHITRSRAVATGAAVLALAVVTGCGGAKESPAAAPATSAPSISQAPTGTAAPSATATPAETAAPKAPAGSSALATGGNLKFGDTANVKVSSKGGWIGALKVTALEKAPKSDYKELGVRDDAGSVYYLRYDITYLSGKTNFPPEGSDLAVSRLTPLTTGDQRLSFSNQSRFKKCTTSVLKPDGTYDNKKEELAVGQTATNMCNIFILNKGTASQARFNDYDINTKVDLAITWK